MPKDNETTEIIKVLDDIVTLEPGKIAQVAAKKISEKYKKIREETARKSKYKIPGEIVRIEKVETHQREVKVPVSIEKPKESGKEAAKKIIKNTRRLGEKKHLKRSWMLMKKGKKI